MLICLCWSNYVLTFSLYFVLHVKYFPSSSRTLIFHRISRENHKDSYIIHVKSSTPNLMSRSSKLSNMESIEELKKLGHYDLNLFKNLYFVVVGTKPF